MSMVKRAKPSSNGCLLQNLKVTKLLYGKQEKLKNQGELTSTIIRQ